MAAVFGFSGIRAEPIEDNGEQAIRSFRFATELPDDSVHANHQVHHVLDSDVLPNRSRRLSSGQKSLDGLVELTGELGMSFVQALAASGHNLYEVSPRLELRAQSAQIVEEGGRRVAELEQSPGLLDRCADPAHGNRHEECLLGREVAVERAGTNPSSTCDLVDRDPHAFRGEHLVRGSEDPLTIPDGVGPDPAGSPLDNRSARSVFFIRSHRSDSTPVATAWNTWLRNPRYGGRNGSEHEGQTSAVHRGFPGDGPLRGAGARASWRRDTGGRAQRGTRRSCGRGDSRCGRVR